MVWNRSAAIPCELAAGVANASVANAAARTRQLGMHWVVNDVDGRGNMRPGAAGLGSIHATIYILP